MTGVDVVSKPVKFKCKKLERAKDRLDHVQLIPFSLRPPARFVRSFDQFVTSGHRSPPPAIVVW